MTRANDKPATEEVSTGEDRSGKTRYLCQVTNNHGYTCYDIAPYLVSDIVIGDEPPVARATRGYFACRPHLARAVDAIGDAHAMVTSGVTPPAKA